MKLKYYIRTNELMKLGYKYDNNVRWWFNSEAQCAVCDSVIRCNYTQFKEGILINTQLHNYTFFTFKKVNKDILDTIYKIHFNKGQLRLKGN
jgi:hypothetical protein